MSGYMIATGKPLTLKPKVFRTLEWACECARELAHKIGAETSVYDVESAACVVVFAKRPGHITAFDAVQPALPFRPDGSSWLDERN